ncbi:glycosyltransferase family 2 protein [Helicobacter zhangjianzhongii]|uniref:glycosyltransferase family 2 protein n=1 Tax=Helicobacter zhangjianzhongii TaxID=2974574 RepID=UPI003D9C6C0B
MVHTPRFSIIIPTYNVEAYIARCLESCINQTFSDIEILVVDDCGSDSSITIAQRYATKDPRIRIIHNAKNLGTFATRIAGIAEARGEYILLVDADDYLHLHACQTLHHATAHNASILHFKAHYTATAKAPLLAKLTHYARYALPTRFCKTPLHNEQIAYNFFLDSRQFPKFTLWDKCYKASLLRHACAHFIDSSFTPIVADDMLFFLVVASLATSYIGIDKRLYFYCLNTHSSMQAPSKKARRIESFSYVANALHSLKLDSRLLPQIVRIMSKDLAALIILESRVLDPRASTPSSVQSVKIARRGGGRARVYTSSTHTACGFWAYPSTKDPGIYTQNPLTISALLRLVIAVLESLPYLYSYVCLYYFYGVCQNLESPFAKKDSACGLESGLCKPHKENKTRGLLTQRGAEIKGLSRKTSEAVQGEAEAGFFSQKPTPLRKVAYAAA